jgi:hypothetical protein
MLACDEDTRMKDLYIVMDYTVHEPNHLHRMTGALRTYADAKNRRARRDHWFGHNRAFVWPMNQNADACIRHIRAGLWTWSTNNVKIVVAGHGQYGVNGGIVVGGAEGANVGTTNAHIAQDIRSITTPFARYWINWSIKLCVCFAGRPATRFRDRVDAESEVNDSMAGRLAAELHRVRIGNFTLKAYFTPVSVGAEHFQATRENDQRQKFRLTQWMNEAQGRYPRGYAFWRPSAEREEHQTAISMLCSITYQDYTDRDPFDGEVLQDFVTTMTEIVRESIAEIAEALHDDLAAILAYRFVDLVHQSHHGAATSRVNKVTWTCTNGRLTHNVRVLE